MPSRGERQRRWVFTINNYTDSDIEALSRCGSEEAKYLIFGKETGENGTPHLQGYVEFKNPRTLRGVSRLIPRAHLEIARGSSEQAAAYCKKDNDFTEFGQISVGRGRRTDLDKIKEKIKEGAREIEIADEYFSRWVVYRRSFAAYRELHARTQPRTDLRVYLLVGDTGVGKTRYVFDRCGGARNPDLDQELWTAVDPELKWFDGYHGHPQVLLDDYRGSAPFEWLLRLLDRYPMSVPVKGSFTQWRPTTIWITSNLTPDQWYPSVDLAPLLRRISKTVSITRGIGDVEWNDLQEDLNNKFGFN